MRGLRALWIIGLLLLAWAAPARAEDRVALVIGNSGYQAVSRLPNAARDATAVAQALREAGFKTVQVEGDLGFDAMRRVLRDFSAEAERADWAVIYYAGHGIEVSGQNYLVPVDARLKSDRDVQFEAVALDQVLASIEGARKLRLVILDACRDNPFIASMTRSAASRSVGRGLARVEPEGGTLVAYAAKAGQVALDGDGANSPFVASLVKRMSTPGVEIGKLFRLVRDDVFKATGRRQEPFVYGSLPGEEFYFRTAAVVAPPLQTPPAAPSAVVPPAPVPPPPAAAAPAPTRRKPPVASLPADGAAPVPRPARTAPPPSLRPSDGAVRSEPARPKPQRRVAEENRVQPSSRVRSPVRAPSAGAAPSANCFVFNGERVCN